MRGLAFTLALFLLALPAAADEDADRSLRGVKSFAVLVEGPSQDAPDIGLSTADIRTAVELKLRLAGITVLSTKDLGQQSGSPYLDVRVSAVGKTPGPTSFSIVLNFMQIVILERDHARVLFASTWDGGDIGHTGANDPAGSIMRALAVVTDRFLNAYLSVNPK